MNCDVIIVGAGAAGCVLASRLSEDPDRRVLLLEAGPDYPTLADLPPEIASAWAPVVSHDWGYASEPDGRGRSLPLPRARLVGGCAATNAAFALRGSPADYDRWQALGNGGWSFADVLPVFRRLESDRDFADEWHGSDGPVPIRRLWSEASTPLQHAFLEAASEAGHATVLDHNRPWAVGAGPGPRNVGDGGVRISTALAYLAPARPRPNLAVLPHVLVDRVVVRRGRATGIRLADPDETIEASTVVLAAGSYGTPAVLYRSGIGPAADLESVGIEVALDLPGVGHNLVDHPLAFVAVPCQPPAEPAPCFHGMVTWHSGRSDPAGPPDLFMAAGGPFEAPADQSSSGAVFNLSFALLAPRSRGRLKPRSADPEAPPRIYWPHLEDEEDLVRMQEALRQARRLIGEEPLAELASGPEVAPGPAAADHAENDLRAWLRANAGTFHHPVGTCRMGPDAAGGDVVDERGRVHGIADLWIADASIMPTIPTAPINLPTIMIAERVAARIAEA